MKRLIFTARKKIKPESNSILFGGLKSVSMKVGGERVKIFMKDGTFIRINEEEPGQARVNFGIDGYVLITGGAADSYARIMAPKESVNFIDLENSGETGLIIEIFPPVR